MDQALELWRRLYEIDEEAYNQLRTILLTFGQFSEFGQPPEVVQFPGVSHANIPLTGQTLYDQNAFIPNIPETCIPYGVPSNEGPSHWYGDAFGGPAHGLDSLGRTGNEMLTERPGHGYGNFHASSYEPYCATAQTVQSDASQSAKKTSYQLAACTRCWKRKHRVGLTIALIVFWLISK
jgi:hypothetical protein